MFKLNCVGSGYYISIKVITERLAMLSTNSFYIKLIAVLLTCGSVVVFGQSVSEMKRTQMDKQSADMACIDWGCVPVDETGKSTDCYNFPNAQCSLLDQLRGCVTWHFKEARRNNGGGRVGVGDTLEQQIQSKCLQDPRPKSHYENGQYWGKCERNLTMCF